MLRIVSSSSNAKLYKNNYQIIKKNISFKREATAYQAFRSFTTKIDKWNCMHINLATSEKINTCDLESLINDAKTTSCKAIWLQSKDAPENVPIAFNCGFTFHVAHQDEFILCKWLLDKELNTLPPTITHQVGVSSVCLNSKGQILMVKDKGTLKFYGDYWKLPGGRVDLNEDLATASVRETFEECGVKTKFKSILGFRETLKHPNVPMNRSDIFYITRVELENAKNDTIEMCTRELYDAQWVDVDKINSFEFPVSKVGEAILSVVRDGLTNGWDSVDIILHTYKWGNLETLNSKAMEKILRGKSFSFYRR